jgi:hypothetical protein
MKRAPGMADDGELVGQMADRVREVPVVPPVDREDLRIASIRERRESERV